MAKAKVGQRVIDRNGMNGTIESVNSFIVVVRWDDGCFTEVPAGSLYKPAKRHSWAPYLIIATALCVIAVIGMLQT